ncbi:type II toxin-antitoxin system ParD family antitoxin [Asticcacaulis sp. YBE204]|nr:type II toxin-antitoxin system ParD family antitoxin [Asticcacaulis sp. YBE204]ESQ80236.1 hypothetical protein AEYBE204_06345 [Asticcacaulis sp. YBE204]
MEDREIRLNALRAHLAEGAEDARQGKFVEYDLDNFIAEMDEETNASD